MNTLSKIYTSTFFNNPGDYDIFIARWSDYVNSPQGKTLTSADFFYYLALLGKNYKKAFFPGRKMQDHDCPEGFWIARYYSKNVINTIGKDLLKSDWKKKIDSIVPGIYDENVYKEDAYLDYEVKKLTQSEVVTIKKHTIFDTVKNFMGLG